MSQHRFRVVDESFVGGKKRDDEFSQLKRSLVQQGKIFVDQEFDPSRQDCIGNVDIMRSNAQGFQVRIPPNTLKWQRPTYIASPDQPVFTDNDATRFDIQQGSVRDCWFIAAMACITNDKDLRDRCIPANQTFNRGDYAGIFRFYFWRYGQWIEVWVDDQLPVFADSPKQLVFAHCFSRNEFWVPLLEKAYAKLYGSYKNLDLGQTTDALVDFTGGISETIELIPFRTQQSTGTLGKQEAFEKLALMLGKSCLVGCSIQAERVGEIKMDNGLVSGHAYSITGVVQFSSKARGMMHTRLLRLRNPWGQREWNGPWSDNSKEMRALTETEKSKAGITINAEDGEFWMSYEDWIQNFTHAQLCLLGADSLSNVTLGQNNTGGRRKWVEKSYNDKWEAGHNAGGNNLNNPMFWKNPQVLVKLGVQGGGVGGGINNNNMGGDKCHMIVSLMEKLDNLQAANQRSIDVLVFKAPPEGQLLDGRNCVLLNTGTAQTSFQRFREVTLHFSLPSGRYVIIPCTFDGNRDGLFLLRTYTETDTQLEELDKQSTIRMPPAVVKEDNILKFHNVAEEPGSMDAKELAKALNQQLARERFPAFNVETARSLVAMFDDDANGAISADEFKKLLTQLRLWKDCFTKCDTNQSGDIDTYELEKLFAFAGFDIGRRVQKAIFHRYSGRSNVLDLEDFIHAASRLVVLYRTYQTLSKTKGPTGIQLSMDDWMAATIAT